MSAQPDVSALVGRAAAERPDATALVAGEHRLTWAELEDQVARVATGIGAAGVVAGQRVLVALGNRVEFVTAYLGTLRAQAVSVPVNPTSTAGELARMVADSGARLAIGDAATLAAVREAVAVVDRARDGEAGILDPDLVLRAVAARVVALDEPPADGELGFDDLVAGVPRAVPPLRDPEKLAALLYTSGTSGRPRAAMLTHRALLANVEQVAVVEPPMRRADDVVLGVLPMFHVYGLNAVLGGVARHGCRLVIAERFEP
ncbi:MAG: AMP-binding protein, partial [Nocardioides sp.]